MGGIFNSGLTEGRKSFGQKSLSLNKATILPTVLRVGQEELDYWTNMTCFYDKNWEFNPKLASVPISFMHITSVTEVTTAQGAEKRVILYESPPSTNKGGTLLRSDPSLASHPSYRSNLEVIMDNVVVQPKQYQMEVIIPDSLIGPYHRQGLSRLNALVEYLQRTDTDIKGSNLDNIAYSINLAQKTINVYEGVASGLDLLLGAYGSSSQMETINKNSIDAMVGSGHVVCFKKWTGYDYTYGIITKLEISKRPTEEGVFRGSITFQETPILNITTKTFGKTQTRFGQSVIEAISYGATQTARLISLGLALPFIKITGVADEAGAVGSKDNSGYCKIDSLF